MGIEIDNWQTRILKFISNYLIMRWSVGSQNTRLMTITRFELNLLMSSKEENEKKLENDSKILKESEIVEEILIKKKTDRQENMIEKIFMEINLIEWPSIQSVSEESLRVIVIIAFASILLFGINSILEKAALVLFE